MDDDQERSRPCINVKGYNAANGKLRASIRWLVSRIYEETEVPDNLRELFFADDKGDLHLTPAITTCLTSGSFYGQAASKIFHDSSFVMKSIDDILKALSKINIEVKDNTGNCVTAEALQAKNHFDVNKHLLLIDSLMYVHLKSIISIERVVQAISKYTPVDKREEPLDCVDALLFWINKICLLVRDDVERNDIALASNSDDATIPEMEDLYEDLCDGTCVCTLVAYYRPAEVPLQEIFFNDPMSIDDCRFNLDILSTFCATSLPWNPFHFEIDDLLFLHENLQPNVNAFLADLFYFFEVSSGTQQDSSSTMMAAKHISNSVVQRRFMPVQAIPGLREQQNTANLTPKSTTNRLSLSHSARDRITSIASADSLMTTRTEDSLNLPAIRQSKLPPDAITTNFRVSGSTLMEDETQNPVEADGHLSMAKSSAEIRLQMEELRRHHEKRQQLLNAQHEQKRTEASKDAFFRVMSKSINNETNLGSARSPSQSQLVDAVSKTDLHKMQNSFDQMNLSQPSQTSTPLQQLHQPQTIFGAGPSQFSQQPQQTTHFPPAEVDPMTGSMGMYGMSYLPGHQQQMPYHPQQQFRQLQGGLDQEFLAAYAFPNASFDGFHNANLLPHQQVLNASYPSSSMTNFPIQHHSFGSINNSPYSVPMVQQPPLNLSQPNALQLLHHQQLQQNLSLVSQAQPQRMPSQFLGQQSTTTMFNTSPFVQPQQQFVQQQTAFAQFPQPNFHDTTSLTTSPSFEQQHFVGVSNEGSTAFRLHQPNISPTANVDPSLEMHNKSLTNWGNTYRLNDRVPRKTWMKNAQTGPESSNDAKSVQNQNMEELLLSPGTSDKKTPSKGQTSLLKTNVADQSERSADDDLSSPKNGPRPGGVVISDTIDPKQEMTAEMQAKRRALLANQMRRKERIIAMSEEKEVENTEKRQTEMQKLEIVEQRKLDRELKRQKLLEDYKRKKHEQDLGVEPTGSGSNSARLTTSTTSLNRGHSQPPIGRPKSQSNLHLVNTRTFQRPSRTQSNLNDENTPRVFTVPSIAEPALKLYAKNQPKSNRGLIMNAIQYSVFPGYVTSDQRNKAQASIAHSDSKHFLVLFRDNRCQYRGLYTWDQFSDTVHRIDGSGPKICKEPMMTMMFKYDSGAKNFGQIPTKRISATIDGFAIADQFWQKPKIPHSCR